MNSYKSYDNYIAEQKKNAGYVRPPKNPFYMVSTFGGLASIIGTFDYLDTYNTKTMKPFLEKKQRIYKILHPRLLIYLKISLKQFKIQRKINQLSIILYWH